MASTLKGTQERRVLAAAMRYYRHVIKTQAYIFKHNVAASRPRLALISACAKLAKGRS